ncbi:MULTISPECIES: C1 family peptidase [Brevibacillus]|uniref:C1 family peptidase n=1 Tax=Brevibacillus TaxID=55080 RepID=UPI00363D6A24
MSKKPFNPKDFSTYGLGLLPMDKKSIPADRVKAVELDEKVSLLATTSVDLRSQFGPIRSQGSGNTCVSFATAALAEWYQWKMGEGLPTLSPSYIHYPTPRSEGMFIYGGIGNMIKNGACREELRPYSNDFSLPLTDAQKADGLPRRCMDWMMHPDGGEVSSIKALLSSKGYPSIIGVRIYPTFDNPNSDGSISMPSAGQTSRGGHAVVVVGYDDTKFGGSFIIRNSWGTGWGLSGYAYLPYKVYDYIKNSFDACYFHPYGFVTDKLVTPKPGSGIITNIWGPDGYPFKTGGEVTIYASGDFSGTNKTLKVRISSASYEQIIYNASPGRIDNPIKTKKEEAVKIGTFSMPSFIVGETSFSLEAFLGTGCATSANVWCEFRIPTAL